MCFPLLIKYLLLTNIIDIAYLSYVSDYQVGACVMHDMVYLDKIDEFGTIVVVKNYYASLRYAINISEYQL